MAVKSFPLNSLAARAGLLAAGLCCLIFLFFAMCWYFGNSIASRAVNKEVAAFAADLAPNDPQTHYALAIFDEKTFLPEDLQKSLTEYEQSAALAPNDYRVWLTLGRAREQNGDGAGAERALRRSLKLAPHYAQVQWTLGNVLLRQGKTDEAFAELRQAAEGDEKYTTPTVSIAGQIYDGNVNEIRRVTGNSNRINFALAIFLANQKKFDEAFEVWNSLPAEEKRTAFKESGEQFFGALLNAGKFRSALEVRNQISDPNTAAPALEKISNSGFESDINAAQAGIFQWQIADGTLPQVGFDNTQKYSGNRSLVIIFNSLDGREFRQVSQTIAVQPSKKYELDFYYKSALKTASTLKWEIADVSGGKVLAATEATAKDTDWTNMKTEFTTLENTEAVTLRLVRDNCQSSICPIAGKVWFDDFSLNAR